MIRFAIFTLIALATGAWATTPGELIYQGGVIVSGEPLRATVQGDVPLEGAQLACAGCHRRSGYGASEGGLFAPPLVAPILLAPREYRRQGWAGAAHTRPAYDERTLLRALRDGIDAAGRPLSPLMPRYTISASQASSLMDYLRSLGSEVAPGVDSDTMHFAVIVAPDADPAHARAWLGALEAFIADKNAGTRHETTRAKQTPWTKTTRYPAYRRWQLHRWNLQGSPDEWRAQLQAAYASQPVFAVLGGVATDWSPIQVFCEGARVPCLFPWSEQVGADPYYTVYFSEGVALEARTIADHVARTMPMASVEVQGPEGLRALFPAKDHTASHNDQVLVVLDPPGRAPLHSLDRYSRVYFRAVWRPTVDTVVPAPLRARVYVSALYRDLAREPRLSAWLERHDLEDVDRQVAGAAVYGASIVGEALMHMGSYFSREYLLDRVEHAVSRSPWPAPFPLLSLGPEQRFAVKTSRIEPIDAPAANLP